MDIMNRNYSLKWMIEESSIFLDEKYKDKILDVDNPIIGVYGFFINEGMENKEKCAYIGKSVNVYERLFKVGQITELMKNTHSNEALSVAVKENKKITIKLLEEVKFDYENYAKDMQKLALAEYQQISKYQDFNECLGQLPEGSNMKKNVWEELRKVKV